MKAYFRKILIIVIALFIFTWSPVLVQAQEAPPCAGPDPIYGDCPIDSGLLILIAIGVGYGIKKVIDSRKAPAME